MFTDKLITYLEERVAALKALIDSATTHHDGVIGRLQEAQELLELAAKGIGKVIESADLVKDVASHVSSDAAASAVKYAIDSVVESETKSS